MTSPLRTNLVKDDLYAAVNTISAAVNTISAALNAAQVSVLVAKTSSSTLVLSDAEKTNLVTSASATTVGIPTNAAVPFPLGTFHGDVQMGTGSVSYVAASGVTLLTPTSLKTRVQYSAISVTKIGTDTWLVGGDAA